MDGLHLRDRSLNAPMLGEIGKHLDVTRHDLSPRFPRGIFWLTSQVALRVV
jgi:hypothetical protein